MTSYRITFSMDWSYGGNLVVTVRSSLLIRPSFKALLMPTPTPFSVPYMIAVSISL